MNRRVVVAMSGGVDSSVAAALVVRAGYEAIGVTLKLMPKLESGFGCCGSPRDVDDAKRVCEKLGIPHYVLDMSELFERKVIAPFVENYLNSRTPNPCVECNRSVKFGYLPRLADAWEAGYVATGHYARVKNGRLMKAADERKDQTYFLHSLTSEVLDRVLFPVGELTKAQVRQIAREFGLATAEKHESQELCFVPARDYRGFVRSRAIPAPSVLPEGEENTEEGAGARWVASIQRARSTTSLAVPGGYHGQGVLPLPWYLRPICRRYAHRVLPVGAAVGVAGPICDSTGRVLGRHHGIENHTIGQRRGLGVASAGALYVTRVDAATNTVFVGPDAETFKSGLVAREVSWTGPVPASPAEIQARIRHRHAPAPAALTLLPDRRVRVDFERPQRAITPGQAVVFYSGEEVIGGGTIQESLSAASKEYDLSRGTDRIQRARSTTSLAVPGGYHGQGVLPLPWYLRPICRRYARQVFPVGVARREI